MAKYKALTGSVVRGLKTFVERNIVTFGSIFGGTVKTANTVGIIFTQ